MCTCFACPVHINLLFCVPIWIGKSLARCLSMSAPSISYTSSFSDSGRSGSSTPSSEFVPSKLYLLPPHFIDGGRLNAFASKLEKGYGDKIILSVAHAAPFDVNRVEAAMTRLGEAIPDVCAVDKQWVKVPEGKTYCIDPMSL